MPDPLLGPIPEVPRLHLTMPWLLGGPAGSSSLGLVDTYARSAARRTLLGGGRTGGADVNLENLTLGNTAGGATEPGRNTNELTLGGGFNAPGGTNPVSGMGTALFASRFGLFRGAEAGLMLGTPLFSVNTDPSPSSALGTLHFSRRELGLYLGGGLQRDPAGGWTYAGSGNIAGTATWGTPETGQTQLYPNFIYNVAGAGQVANTNVRDFRSITGLIGLTRAGADSPNTWGGEAALTFNYGEQAGLSPRTSLAATVLAFYQRGFGSTALGIGLGGSYETGGGWTGFLRLGIGLDRPASVPLPYPSLGGSF